MLHLSRRSLALGCVSASVLAVAALGQTSKTTLEFKPDKDMPEISFAVAREVNEGLVKHLIDRSEKAFGITYSEQDRKRIYTRVWDKTQLVFAGFYKAKEGN